ncbi:MAG: hypothetical protein IJX47_05035 [Clostridia bacterium]|nr:hypothetical protein [Clostridia bacterium]
MDFKTLFPVSFNLNKYVKLEFKENPELYWMIVEIVVYVLAGIIASAVIGVLWTLVGFLGILWGIVDGVIGLYIIVGIVLSVLKFCKVIQ